MRHTSLWAIAAALVLAVALPAAATAADNGNAPATLSFFSSGSGAHASWYQDNGNQEIHIHVTPGGYAGVLVHHVYGWPTADYPSSSFDFRSSLPSPFSLGYPRLVIRFSDGGNASLRPLTWTTGWQHVDDPNWDNNAGGCGFLYQRSWPEIQACHAGTFITNAYITTDPGGPEVDFYIDNLRTAGKVWGEAADNGNGDNTAAFLTPDLLTLLLG
jgi:hypothetical protein